MIILPSAIVFVNNDLTDNVLNKLKTQLFITDVFDGYTFDGYVNTYQNFLTVIKAQNRRVLVIRPFNDYTNRNMADVAMFIKNGLASIEYNKFGPPGQTYKVLELYWGKLGIFI